MLKDVSTYNQNILSIITNRQSEAQGKYGCDWWYKKSVFYKINSGLRAVLLLFTVFINYLILANYSMRIADASNASVRAIYKNAYNSFLIGTIIVGVAFVVLNIARRFIGQIKLKKNVYLIAFLVALVGAILLSVTAYDVLVGANIKNMYAEAVESSDSAKIYLQLFLAHIVPLLITAYTFLMSFIMENRDFKEKDTMYKNLTETLYRDFTQKNPQFSDETWQQYLDSYKDVGGEEC